jgi:signal transduction histidine kinase/ActR/RegA family two-component response regulator
MLPEFPLDQLPQAVPLFQAVIDALPQQLAILDQAGEIVALNRAWETFSGENNVGHGGLGDSYLAACEQLGGEIGVAEAGVRAVLGGATEFKLEYACQRSPGERWFMMQATPLPSATGGAVVSHLDITARKQLEAERAALLVEAQQTRDAAEATNHAKDEFLAQTMHDLRSPLSAILGWTKVLRSRPVKPEEQAEALAVIEHSAEKQKRLIEDLLDISRIVSGKLKLNVRPVSLSEVIRSAMEVMRPAWEAKEIECSVELATEADAITGDAARLEQVIWNLVANAVKFTPPKGTVSVKLERADPFVRITVSDTGKGICAADLPNVFQRYWQAAESGGRRVGLGLGLSFVKHIVELHGGTVTVESPGAGQGASFIINLPYRAVSMPSAQAAFLSAAPEKKAISALLGGLLIVVVDDEADARDLLKTVLRQQGAEVLTASAASEAYRLIAEAVHTPDLLISDISMPGEDGYSLIRRIRSLPPGQGGRIPAVALTAFGRMEDRVRALNAGFEMHLPKPVELTELVLVAASLSGREIVGHRMEQFHL